MVIYLYNGTCSVNNTISSFTKVKFQTSLDSNNFDVFKFNEFLQGVASGYPLKDGNLTDPSHTQLLAFSLHAGNSYPTTSGGPNGPKYLGERIPGTQNGEGPFFYMPNRTSVVPVCDKNNKTDCDWSLADFPGGSWGEARACGFTKNIIGANDYTVTCSRATWLDCLTSPPAEVRGMALRQRRSAESRRQGEDPEVFIRDDGTGLAGVIFSGYVEISAAARAAASYIRYTVDRDFVDCAQSPLMGPKGVLLSVPGVLRARECSENGGGSGITEVGFAVEPGYDMVMYATITSSTPVSPAQLQAMREDIAAAVGIDWRTLALVVTVVDDEEADAVKQSVTAQFTSPTNSMRATLMSKATEETLQAAISTACEDCVIKIHAIELKNKGKTVSSSEVNAQGELVPSEQGNTLGNTTTTATIPLIPSVQEAIADFASSQGALALFITLPIVLLLALIVWYRCSRKAAIDERAAWLKKTKDFVKPTVVQSKSAKGRHAASAQPDFVIAGDVVEIGGDNEDREVCDMQGLKSMVTDETDTGKLIETISDMPAGMLEQMEGSAGSAMWGIQMNTKALTRDASDRSKGFQEFVQPTIVQSKYLPGGKGAAFDPEFVIAGDVVEMGGVNANRDPAQMDPFKIADTPRSGSGTDRSGLTETICDIPQGIIDKMEGSGAANWGLQSGNAPNRKALAKQASDRSKGFQEFVQPTVVQSKYLPGAKGAAFNPEFVVAGDVVSSGGENANKDPAKMQPFKISDTPRSNSSNSLSARDAIANMTPRGHSKMPTPRSAIYPVSAAASERNASMDSTTRLSSMGQVVDSPWSQSTASLDAKVRTPIYTMAVPGTHTFYPSSSSSSSSGQAAAATERLNVDIRGQLVYNESEDMALDVAEEEMDVYPPGLAAPAPSDGGDTMSVRSWEPYPQSDAGDSASVASGRSSRTNSVSGNRTSRTNSSRRAP